jgi:hypothetical protein
VGRADAVAALLRALDGVSPPIREAAARLVWADLVATAHAADHRLTGFDEPRLERIARATCAALPPPAVTERRHVWTALEGALGYPLPPRVGFADAAEVGHVRDAVTRRLQAVLDDGAQDDAQLCKDVPRARYSLGGPDGVETPLSTPAAARDALRAAVDGDDAWYGRIASLANQTMLNALHDVLATPGAPSLVTLRGAGYMPIGGSSESGGLCFNVCRVGPDRVRVEATHAKDVALLLPAPGNDGAERLCATPSRYRLVLAIEVRRPGSPAAAVSVGRLTVDGDVAVVPDA